MSDVRSTAPDDAYSPDVVYVMTHHPRTALTFIANEIDQIRRLGGRVSPVAVNVPVDDDLATSSARRAVGETLYLKAQVPAAVRRSLSLLVKHPIRMTRLLARAVASAGIDPRLVARRVVHLGYATVVHQHAERLGARHLHAHFGQAPATVAWFAAEISNFSGRHRWTWSFTIHGFQDFIDEHVARLDQKAVSASHVVCVSDFTRSQLCRITDPALWDRFHVIRCGVDLDSLTMRQPRPIRPVPRIVIVARLSPEKGHLVLLLAARRLRERGVEVAVEIIGDGPSRSTIATEAQRLGLTEQITHAGELPPDAVIARLGEADVFCLPSFSEGLPVSIMEAMAVGVPVVTTFISGIPELAIDGETALTVPASNVEALADALERVITDPDLRARIVRRAREAVEERHSIERNVADLAEIFRRVAPSRGGGSGLQRRQLGDARVLAASSPPSTAES